MSRWAIVVRMGRWSVVDGEKNAARPNLPVSSDPEKVAVI